MLLTMQICNIRTLRPLYAELVLPDHPLYFLVGVGGYAADMMLLSHASSEHYLRAITGCPPLSKVR